MALYRHTRQIVAWSLGARSLQGARDLRATLPKDYQGCHTRNDKWEAYAVVFPADTRLCLWQARGL